jgi:nicotinamidase-related amidase
MNTEKALVVIDMQPYFPATKKALRPVISEVKRAMKHEVPILLVELHNGYDDFGITHGSITRAVEGYPYVQLVHKAYNDGSVEVKKALDEQWGLGKETALEVCGVNTGACVADTAQGLAKKGFDVTVIQKACGDGDGYHDSQIELWHENPHLNVKVA